MYFSMLVLALLVSATLELRLLHLASTLLAVVITLELQALDSGLVESVSLLSDALTLMLPESVDLLPSASLGLSWLREAALLELGLIVLGS